MSDEKLSTPERPPEKEEAAPAPASALETAPIYDDVTNDITASHDDTHLITKAIIAGSSAGDAGAGDLADDGADPQDTEMRAYKLHRLAYLSDESSLCGEQDVNIELRGYFDELDDDVRRFLRVWWEGKGKERNPDRFEDWHSCAVDVYRELTGIEPDDGFERRWTSFAELGRPSREGMGAGCHSCLVVALAQAAKTQEHPDAEVGRALTRAGFAKVALCAHPSALWSTDNSRDSSRAVRHMNYENFPYSDFGDFAVVGRKFDEKFRECSKFVNGLAERATKVCTALVKEGGLAFGGPAHMEAARVVRAELAREHAVSPDRLEALPEALDPENPLHAEIAAAVEAAVRAKLDAACAKLDPWRIGADLGPFLMGTNGLICWQVRDAHGRVQIMLSADAERAIFHALENAVRVKGVPTHEGGEPDLGAMARFYVGAGEQYTLAWNRAKARKLGKNDPHANEKDPALAIRWSPELRPEWAMRITELAREAIGRPVRTVDHIIQHISEHGLEVSENAANGKRVEGAVRGWALELNPTASEEWIGAYRARLRMNLPQVDTQALAKSGEIDVNAWRINEGSWYFASAGPHAKKMRRFDPSRLSDWAAQIADGVYLEPVGEPDEDGWYAVKEPEDVEFELLRDSGELGTWRPSDQARAMFPEDPEAGQDVIDQTFAFGMRQRNIHRMQGLEVLRGDGGDGKTTLREILITATVGIKHPELRDTAIGGVRLEDMHDKELVLSLTKTRINFPDDSAQDPALTKAGWGNQKPISSGGSVVFKVKYEDPLTTSSVAQPCIYLVNGVPTFPAQTKSKKRRLFIVHCRHSVPDSEVMRELADLILRDPRIATWFFWHSVCAYPEFNGFHANRLADESAKEAEAEADALAQAAAGVVPLLCGHAWPLPLVYQLMSRWMAKNMSNSRMINYGPKVKREFSRVFEPYGLVVVPDRQFRVDAWYDPEVMAAPVHSVCEAVVHRDKDGEETGRDYKPAELSNWVDALGIATGGRDRVTGMLVRKQDWDAFQAVGRKQFDQHERVWLDVNATDGDATADDNAGDASLYDGVYLPLLAGLAKAGCTALSGGPVAALPLERWLAAGGPCVPVALGAGALKGGEAGMLDDNPELQLGAPQALCGSPNGAVVALLPRPATGLLAPRADDPWLDPLALIVSGRAEIAAGNAPAVAPDPDPDDDPTPGPGGGAPEAPSIDPARDAEALRECGLTVEGAAPTTSDAPEGAKTGDETAAQGTCDVSAPADGAHEAPAPSDRAPATNGPSAPAETPVSAAPAAVEGGDAAEEAPGGPEGTTVCREVIGEDEWAVYGRPTRVTRTVEVDGERLPLIE